MLISRVADRVGPVGLVTARQRRRLEVRAALVAAAMGVGVLRAGDALAAVPIEHRNWTTEGVS